MLARRRLWILGTFSLIGVSLAGYAYALDCAGPPTEILDMQLISVTYDGTPQVDPPDYYQVSGRLTVSTERSFFVDLEQQDGTSAKSVESGYFNAE